MQALDPKPVADLWLDRNEEMDASSSPYIAHYGCFPFLFIP